MFDAAASVLQLFVRDGYRTQKEQTKIRNDRIREYEESGYAKKESKELAKKYIANPGVSEYQLGLSVANNADTSDCSSEEVYTWLFENAHKYSFIKRYPFDKIAITGINEPWHYRYVGKMQQNK